VRSPPLIFLAWYLFSMAYLRLSIGNLFER